LQSLVACIALIIANTLPMLSFQVAKNRLLDVQKPAASAASWLGSDSRALAGICNTDVEILRGYHQFRGTPGMSLSAKS